MIGQAGSTPHSFISQGVNRVFTRCTNRLGGDRQGNESEREETPGQEGSDGKVDPVGEGVEPIGAEDVCDWSGDYKGSHNQGEELT